MPKYLFFDFDPNVVKPLQDHLPKLFEVEQYDPSNEQYYLDLYFYIGDIKQLKNMKLVTHWVSPANSYGNMNGGIDAIYKKLFPKCEKKVKDQIQTLQCILPMNSPTTSQPILSVGSALTVTLGSPLRKFNRGFDQQFMISAPTMETPHHIRANPQNVYYAMYAILQVTKDLPDDAVVAIPGLGTGVGRLTGEEASQQIIHAVRDLINYKTPDYPTNVTRKYQSTEYYLISPPFLF